MLYRSLRSYVVKSYYGIIDFQKSNVMNAKQLLAIKPRFEYQVANKTQQIIQFICALRETNLKWNDTSIYCIRCLDSSS